MREFKRREQGPGMPLFLLKCMGALVLLVLSVLAARGAWEMYARFRIASLEAGGAKSELMSLKGREREIAASVASFSSERGVEREVRERYGVVRPGEGKIEIVRDPESEELGPLQAEGNVVTRFLRSLFVW